MFKPVFYFGKNSNHFDIKSLPGLFLWLDGADASTITQSSGAVSQWSDKSGNANHAIQPTGSSQPIYTSNAHNGLASLTFNGSGVLGGSMAIGFEATVFVVGTASLRSGFIEVSPNSSVNTQWSILTDYYSNGTVPMIGRRCGSGGIDDAQYTYANGVLSLVSFKSSTTGGYIYQNGKLQASNLGTVPELTSTTYTVGGLESGYYYLVGDIAEIVVYGSTLGDTDRKKVEQYLMTKWGLTPAAIPTPVQPDALSGLVLWLDGSDGSTITQSSGSVSRWADKSSTGNHATQLSGSNQPTYGSNLINGNNTLTFDGSADYFTLTNPVSGNPCTLISVVQYINNNRGPILGDITADTFYGVYSDSSFYIYGGGLNMSSPVNSDAAPHIYTAILSPNNNNLYFDGSALLTGRSGTFTASFPNVGARSGNYIQGSIAEVVAYDVTLTDTQRLGVEQYLKNKWGIA